VERDRAKFPTLLKNVAISERRIECKALPVELFLQRNQTPFDIVFLDPPFPYAYRLELMQSLSDGPTLKVGGLALLHFPHEERLPEKIGSLFLENEKRYGRSTVRFYRKSGNSL
jgi:16S rRNA G966 N2-methylase RsmD